MVSVVGLLLVWGLVWANLPSKDELLGGQPHDAVHEQTPQIPELDLSIPGVPARSPFPSSQQGGVQAGGTSGASMRTESNHARQIAELKCEADLQQSCPESLHGDARRRCVSERMKQFTPFCQQIAKQRLVRWKATEGYRAACADDVKRVCRGVEPGEGRILQCLQDRAADLSETCYQNLPKGQLFYTK